MFQIRTTSQIMSHMLPEALGEPTRGGTRFSAGPTPSRCDSLHSFMALSADVFLFLQFCFTLSFLTQSFVFVSE